MKDTTDTSALQKSKPGRKGIASKQMLSEAERIKFRLGFAARFRERRIALGMTQPQLARELGISQGRIAKYENTRALPRLNELSEVCRKLKCDPHYLLHFPDATSAKSDSASMLIEAVRVTGGLVPLANGLYAPVADYDWIDLAEAYLRACDEKGVNPLIRADLSER